MKNLLLVDNAAYSYAYQPDNGVPILPYFQGKNDFELKALGDYLLSLSNEKELRCINSKIFKLNRYT
jgi:CTD small phosphatase-like protein 2